MLAAAPQPARRTGAAVQVRPISWSEAMPIVNRLEDALPPSLREIPRSERPARWTAWVSARRKALAARVAQGDVDSVVNLLLFGTSFTKEPRITAKLLKDLDQRWKAGDRSVQDTLTRQYQQRAGDLIAAAASPRAGERMQDVRRVLAAHGHLVTTGAGRKSAVDFLFTNLARVGEEAAKLASELEAARRAADPTAGFAERSRVFRDRGLAGDSSLLTQFAVDRGVCGLRDRGVAADGSIARVAVIGPGLDFADKQEGFDFYPPQSLQPFTLADSLIRCGLSSQSTLQITTLDISPRVNAHLRAAVTGAASRKAAYRLVLPWTSDAGWTDDAVAYWKHAGAAISEGPPAQSPAPLPGVQIRTLAVSPTVVRKLRPLEASIVSDRLDLASGERFDLVLATNVLLYYDTFEQTLALGAIAAMLRAGGVLLTNDAVLEIPEIPLRSRGYVTVPFSARPGDGERVVIYVKAER